MQFEETEEPMLGTLDSVPDRKVVEKIFDYTVSVLQKFHCKVSENENSITNKLCKSLNANKPKKYHIFYFHHQNLEDPKTNASTDFAAFISSSSSQGEALPLVTFEAKRLSTKLPKQRSKEYVIGEYKQGKQIKNSGGIERFKNETHGKNITHAAMLGYVQTGTFADWLKKINGWIQEEIERPQDRILTWDSNDYLQKDKHDSLSHKVCCYVSQPTRKTSKPLHMRHIWVRFN